MAVKAQDSRYRGDINNPITHSEISAMGLTKVTEWKQQIVGLLLQNQNLLKLLFYSTPDALSRPDISAAQAVLLVSNGPDKQIYQYRHIMRLARNKKSYLSMDVSHARPYEGWRYFSQKYMSAYIYIYILCDIDVLDTDTGVRSDLIMAEVYKSIDGIDSVIGMGKMHMETGLPLWVDNNSFGGWSLGFKLTDLK